MFRGRRPFCPFGARFPVFRSRLLCAWVRDCLTISDCSRFWHTYYLLPFEGHCGPRDQLRGRTPLPVPNSQFSGPRAARFGPRTFILHRFWFVFGRDLCFIARKVIEGWEASNCSVSQLYPIIALRRPISPTSKPMLTTLGPFSCTLNPIFVMYTSGRPPIFGGRPVIALEPLEPL